MTKIIKKPRFSRLFYYNSYTNLNITKKHVKNRNLKTKWNT